MPTHLIKVHTHSDKRMRCPSHDIIYCSYFTSASHSLANAAALHHGNLPVVSHVAAKSRSPHPKCFCRKAIQCPAATLGQVLSVFAPLIAATTAVPLHDEKTRTLSLLVLGVRGGDSPQRSGARSCTRANISFKTASFTKAYGLIARVTADSCHNSSSRCCSGV